MQLNIDAEFQNLIPPLSDEEFRQLEENIKSEGCRDALVIWQGIIVDGHNRYKICQENNLPFKTEEKEFISRDEVIEWILKNQLGRRNLNDLQRVRIALRYKEVIAEQMKEKQVDGGEKGRKSRYAGLRPIDPKPDHTTQRKELAKIAGVSEGNAYRAKTILEKGSPEQIDRAEKGGKGNSVYAVYNEVTSKEKPDKKQPEEIPDLKSEKSLFQVDKEIPKPTELEPEKFDFNKLSMKDQRRIEQAVYDSIKNPNRVRKLPAEALVGQIKVNLSTTLKNLESMLEEYAAMVMDKENNPKIIAVLSEAETAIKKLKGKYLYE